jgi:hypothetical protein
MQLLVEIVDGPLWLLYAHQTNPEFGPVLSNSLY